MPGKSTILPILSPFSHFTFLFIVLTAFSIELNATTLFHIDCPPDTTVDCDAELWDLSIYGTAYAESYEGTVALGDPIWVERYQNDCGTGHIERTWVAYDYNKREYYCTQTIYIGGGGGVHITWPEDLVIEECSPDIDPDDLAPPFDKPVVKEDGCSQIMMSYEDTDFKIYGSTDCRKILRKWTVIDWCSYDKHEKYSKGRWEHTQIIKVIAPGEPILTCPKDTTISADADCSGAYVQMDLATAISGCGSELKVTNNSPYADDSGADASGHYPIGVTKVVFKVADQCGKNESCIMYVTVKDLKAPSPICYYGIAVALMPMEGGPALMLQPHFFNKGSYDNCTPTDKLTYAVEPEMVTCADLGQTQVKLTVTDKSGNSAYCYTVVNVQDNGLDCPPNDGLISGRLLTADGTKLQDKQVTLEGFDSYQMTNGGGKYTFNDVPLGKSYSVRPETTIDNTDGINTLDLLVILKHILGVERIDNPYLALAADIDQSGDVTVNDLITLKDLIIKKHYKAKTETQWRYVDANASMDAMKSGTWTDLPVAYDIPSLDGDMRGLNFVGYKVGDVSGDVNTPSLLGRKASVHGHLVLTPSKTTVQAGEEFEIIVSLKSEYTVNALQFALEVDPDQAEVIAVQQTYLSNMEKSNTAVRKDAVSAIWFDLQSTVVGEKNDVISVRMRANADVRPSELFTLSQGPSKPLAYSASHGEMELLLDGSSHSQIDPVKGQILVESAFPNPFKDQASIPVTLDQDQILEIELIDEQGRLLRAWKHSGNKGKQLIEVQSDGYSGLLICRITGLNETKYVKMISQRRD